MIAELEARLYEEYKHAAEDIQAKLLDFWNAFEAKDKGMKNNVKRGKITQKQYDNWRIGQFIVGTRWLNLLEELATDLHNTNAIAHSMIYDFLPAAYAENHNYMTYRIEHKLSINTSFTLYNHEAVERIMTENPQMLPPPGKKRSAKIAAGEEATWNKKQIQSVATQAILQGESIPEVAHRLAETVGERNMNAAVRDARTMMTNAENLGREDSIKRANKLGIPTRKVWLATLDGRTRHAHRQLDGQVVDEDKPFKVDGHEIWRPGDPKAPPYLVYNCRCTMLSDIKDFELSDRIQGFELRNDPRLGGMSYDEWKNATGNEAFFKMSRNAKKDRDQYYAYRKMKVAGYPQTFGEFQRMKYYEPDKWKAVKSAVREKRTQKAQRAKNKKKADEK